MELTANWANKSITASGESMVMIRVPISGLDEIDTSDHIKLANFGFLDTPRSPGGADLWSNLTVNWGEKDLVIQTDSVDQGAAIRLAIDNQLPLFAGEAENLQRIRDRANDLLREKARVRNQGLQKLNDDIGN